MPSESDYITFYLWQQNTNNLRHCKNDLELAVYGISTSTPGFCVNVTTISDQQRKYPLWPLCGMSTSNPVFMFEVYDL